MDAPDASPERRDWSQIALSTAVERIPLELIRCSGSPRRVLIDDTHLRLLSECDSELPPIVVHRATMQVIDGTHRLHAAKRRGSTHISVRFFDGNETEAFALAVHLNVIHGLPLTLADRKAAACVLLRAEPGWSDRLIGRITGVSHKTVGRLRDCSSEGPPQSNTRVGSDGRIRPVAAAEGRRRAAAVINAQPAAPLRKIAKQAGVSVATAREVRLRVRRGDSPLTNRMQASILTTSAEPDHAARCDRHVISSESTSSAEQRGSTLLHRLRKDPALRMSERGRQLLRSLTAANRHIGECTEALTTVPAHCASTLAEVARVNAHAWIDVANRLDDQTVMTSASPRPPEPTTGV